MKKSSGKSSYRDEILETSGNCGLMSLDVQELYMICNSLNQIKDEWTGRKLDLNASRKKIDEIAKSLEQQADELLHIIAKTNHLLFNEELMKED